MGERVKEYVAANSSNLLLGVATANATVTLAEEIHGISKRAG